MNTSWDLPAPGTIDLWQAGFQGLVCTEMERDLLSEEEKMRADRFRFPLHRQRFVASHAFLRKILSNYTDTSPERLTFGFTMHNKPFLQTPATSLQFNLSHSDERVLIGVATQNDIGVDIEKIRPEIDPAIAERFFHPRESALLRTLPEAERSRVFFRLWAGKEAVIKMTGKGLAGSLESFILDPLRDTLSLHLETGPCELHWLATTPDHMAAVALSGPIRHLRQRNIHEAMT